MDDLVKQGYADGNYTCVCGRCGGHFMGDKRAITCKGCATAAVRVRELERENERLRHIVDLLEDGFRCRSCGQVFVGHDGHDDCPMRHPNWDRLTMEQIAELARAPTQGETS